MADEKEDCRLPDFPTQLPLALLNPIVGVASDPGDLVVDLVRRSPHAAELLEELPPRLAALTPGERPAWQS